jgi:hypothetical protein
VGKAFMALLPVLHLFKVEISGKISLEAAAMSEITMKDKLAVLANDLVSRKPTTAFEQALASEAKRDAPAGLSQTTQH